MANMIRPNVTGSITVAPYEKGDARGTAGSAVTLSEYSVNYDLEIAKNIVDVTAVGTVGREYSGKARPTGTFNWTFYRSLAAAGALRSLGLAAGANTNLYDLLDDKYFQVVIDEFGGEKSTFDIVLPRLVIVQVDRDMTEASTQTESFMVCGVIAKAASS